MMVLRYPFWTHADPMQPAVNSSAIAWPAAPNALLVVGDWDSSSARDGTMLLMNMFEFQMTRILVDRSGSTVQYGYQLVV